ncbi:hypothetical protein O6H91_09G062500 [Diphasiastrum complanatum]|nr:hypothetical protein O6H91_09G062500 [Diphasiastrum complanatum]
MAYLQSTSKTGSVSSFGRFETSEIRNVDQDISNVSKFCRHRRATAFNVIQSTSKALIATTSCAKISPFSCARSQSIEMTLRSHVAKKHRPRCYGRSMVCSACTMHAFEAVTDHKMDGRTLYDVLGVSNKAEVKEIKAAYRQQVRHLHPDVAPLEKREEFTTAFLQMHAAYMTLAEPRSRAKYDLQLSLTNFRASGYTDRRYSLGNITGIGEANSQARATAAETATSYPWARSSSSEWKGRNWETDQCW